MTISMDEFDNAPNEDPGVKEIHARVIEILRPNPNVAYSASELDEKISHQFDFHTFEEILGLLAAQKKIRYKMINGKSYFTMTQEFD